MSMTSKRVQRRRKIRFSSVLLVACIVLFITPVIVTKIHNAYQYRTAQEYSRNVAALNPAQREQLFTRAQAYNQSLGEKPLADPWSHTPDHNSVAYREYESLLSLVPGAALGRVMVPSIGVDLPIFHGTDQTTLYQGVGHLYGSALPVGGVGKHAVLTGHTGISTSTLFDNLDKVRRGDLVEVEVAGQLLGYRVSDIKVVLPTELEGIRPVAGKDLLTLITCTPYGINSHRLLVTGERVELPPANQRLRTFANPWQWWMWLFLALAAVAFILLLLPAKKRRREKSVREDEEVAFDVTSG